MFHQRNLWKLGCIALVLLGVMFSASLVPSWAQEARGTVTGKVLDASQQVIPGANIVVKNLAMGTAATTQTTETGLFRVPYLIPGAYQITVEVRGFKKYVRDNLDVRVASTVDLEIVLELGAQEQTITVTAEAPLLETTNATMGQVVDSRRVADLPLAHGNPYALIGMAAGASFNNTAANLNRPFEPTHIVGYAINGSRANRMDVMIDGVPSTATANANEVIASYVPPVDIVQEFKVQTAGFDASYGQTEGGVTNISLKSGTNNFHGTGYWANQAKSLAANEWVNNKTNKPLPDWTYNRWGGSLGGPFYIPKLYNGKNKTFFMWGYEAIHEARPRNNCGNNCTVPTEANKNGDFSQQLQAGGSAYQIYNPFTRRAIAGGLYQSDPFVGNIVPQQYWDPVAKKVLDGYYPKTPNSPGNALGQINQYDLTLPETITYYTHSFKVDQVLNEKQRLFVTARFYKRDSNYNNYLGSIATGEWFQFLSRAGGVDYVNAINASTVLNLRYGYNRFVRSSDGNPGSYGMDQTVLGFPSYMNDYTSEDIRRFPGFAFPTGSAGTGYIGTRHDNFVRPIDTHVFGATANKIVSAHSLRMGMEFRAYRENNRTAHGDMTGTYSFDSVWTRGPRSDAANAPAGTAQSMAAMLMGLPTSGYMARLASYAEQSTAWGIFVQDDWKVNDRLILNFGLRWEYEGALTERFDRSVRGFEYSYVQPIEAQARTNYAKAPIAEVPVDQFNVRGGYNYANVNGQPRGLYNTPKSDFLPQFGFAWRITEKMVMRGGYGINYGFLGQRRGDVTQAGFSLNTALVPTLDNGLTWNEKLSTPFKTGVVQPTGSANGPRTDVGNNLTYFNPEPKVVYNQRWQLGFQQQLWGGWVADMAYVGNRGTHIEIARDLNATPNWYLSTSPTRDTARNAYLTGTVDNPFYGLIPVTTTIGGSKKISRESLMRPYPEFGSVNTTTNQGYSWYHSFQAGLQKRFSHGYTLAANYTWSKFMQATEYLNPADPMPTEVISDMDTPHRLSVTGIWELPFGKGKAIGGNVSGIADRFLSGWQVNGNYAVQSARPIGWGNYILNGEFKEINLGDAATPDRWFNTNAGFNKVSSQQLVKNVRTFPLRMSFVRTDVMNNVDFSVIKNTKIVEGKELQFRAEALNFFNHPNFGAPDSNPTSANFGIVSGTYNYSRRIQLSVKFIF